MPTITLADFNENICVNRHEYEWLVENKNKPLPLSSVDYDREGKVRYVGIYYGDTVMLAFLAGGKATYKLDNLHGVQA